MGTARTSVGLHLKDVTQTTLMAFDLRDAGTYAVELHGITIYGSPNKLKTIFSELLTLIECLESNESERLIVKGVNYAQLSLDALLRENK